MATYIPQKTEGDASTPTDRAVPIMVRRSDGSPARTDADGDYTALTGDAAGRLKVTSDQPVPVSLTTPDGQPSEVSVANGIVTVDQILDFVRSRLAARVVSFADPPSSIVGALADLICTRHGVLWTIGGDPGCVRTEFSFTTSQTNATLVAGVQGQRIIVTSISAVVDGDCTVNVAVRVGFAAETLPTTATTGVSGIVLSHPDIPAGSGIVEGNGSGILARGGNGEPLLLTCDAATGGSVRIIATYHTIDAEQA